jgi:hypothetical protein
MTLSSVVDSALLRGGEFWNREHLLVEPALSIPPHSPVLSANGGEREDSDAPREKNR